MTPPVVATGRPRAPRPSPRSANSWAAPTPSSTTGSSRRSRRSSTAAAARSSCSAPGGASRRCTSSRRCCCAAAAPARPCSSPRCSPSCATRSPPPSVRACAPWRSTRRTRTSGATCSRRLDRDEVDVLLVSPERLNNPSFREQQLPALVRAHRTARRRRGALHQRLGPRLPPRLPAAARPHRADARRRAGAGDDGDGEQPGGGGCRRAARHGRRPRCSRSAGRSPARRCGSACCACPTRRTRLGLAAQPPRRPAGLGHHLHAHGRRRRTTPRGCCASAGTTCAPTPARPTPTSARSPRRC